MFLCKAPHTLKATQVSLSCERPQFQKLANALATRILVSLLEAWGTDRGYPDGRHPESNCRGREETDKRRSREGRRGGEEKINIH